MEHPWNSLSNVPEPHLVLCRSGLLDRTGLFDGTHMVWASFCRLHAELIPFCFALAGSCAHTVLNTLPP